MTLKCCREMASSKTTMEASLLRPTTYSPSFRMCSCPIDGPPMNDKAGNFSPIPSRSRICVTTVSSLNMYGGYLFLKRFQERFFVHERSYHFEQAVRERSPSSLAKIAPWT